MKYLALLFLKTGRFTTEDTEFAEGEKRRKTRGISVRPCSCKIQFRNLADIAILARGGSGGGSISNIQHSISNVQVNSRRVNAPTYNGSGSPPLGFTSGSISVRSVNSVVRVRCPRCGESRLMSKPSKMRRDGKNEWAMPWPAGRPDGGPAYRREGGAMEGGICTATTWPRAQISPPADTVSATTTLRPFISVTRPRISSGTPSGVGRR